jgi:hypothetical protein
MGKIGYMDISGQTFVVLHTAKGAILEMKNVSVQTFVVLLLSKVGYLR